LQITDTNCKSSNANATFVHKLFNMTNSVTETIQQDIAMHLQSAQNSFSYNVNKGLGYTIVFIFYILGILALIFPFIANRVFPFQVLSKISNTDAVINAIGSKADAQAFVFGVNALLFLLGVLLIIIAMIWQKSITRNSALYAANKLLKQINTKLLDLAKGNTEDKKSDWKELEAKELPEIK
jgi:hypothetical protein